LYARTSAIPSRRFAKHSSRVRPCPFAPGTSAQYAMNQGPSCSTIALNSLCISFNYLAKGSDEPKAEVVLDRCLVGCRLEDTALPVLDNRFARFRQLEFSAGGIERLEQARPQLSLTQSRSPYSDYNLRRLLKQWHNSLPCFPQELPMSFDAPMAVILALPGQRLCRPAKEPQPQPLVLVIIGDIQVWRRRDDGGKLRGRRTVHHPQTHSRNAVPSVHKREYRRANGKACRLRRYIVVRIRWSKQVALDGLSDCLCVLEVYDWTIWRAGNRLDHRRARNCRLDAPFLPSTSVNVGDALLLALLRHFGCGGYACVRSSSSHWLSFHLLWGLLRWWRTMYNTVIFGYLARSLRVLLQRVRRLLIDDLVFNLDIPDVVSRVGIFRPHQLH